MKILFKIIVLALALVFTAPVSAKSDIIVVNRSELGKYWEHKRPRKSRSNPEGVAILRVEVKGAERFHKKKDSCVGYVYLINKSGSTEAFRVISAYPDDKLVKFHARKVKGYRFTATPTNPEKKPVYTYGVYTTPNAKSVAVFESPEFREAVERTAKICRKSLDEYIQQVLTQAG